MARKTKSRVDMRREAEAAEAVEEADKKKPAKKKAKAKRKTATKKSRAKEEPRRRLIWAIFNGSMKEEARFDYGSRAEAEEKLEQLRAKANKKLYFLQPLKVSLTDETAKIDFSALDDEDEEEEKAAAAKKKPEAEGAEAEGESEEEEGEEEESED
ncbi:MAG: hypothetical protein AAF532_14975 [Planctomycetota bacterium]